MDIQHTINRLMKVGLTQAQIAVEIRRSQSTVCELAAGRYGKARPSAEVVDGLKRLESKFFAELDALNI